VQIANLTPGDHVAYQPHPSRKPQRVVVLDTHFYPEGQQGQALVGLVDEETGEPNGPTINVKARAITGTWDESLAAQARIRAVEESAARLRSAEHERLSAVAVEIGELIGTKAGDLPVGVDASNNIIISLDVLLETVKAARTAALDEFQGKGGRFGPAPA